MDADAITYDLKHQDIIAYGDRMRIRKIDGREQKNQDLHECLKDKCTKEALMIVCDILIGCNGNPKMKKFGQDMKQRLDQGRCCV